MLRSNLHLSSETCSGNTLNIYNFNYFQELELFFPSSGGRGPANTAKYTHCTCCIIKPHAIKEGEWLSPCRKCILALLVSWTICAEYDIAYFVNFRQQEMHISFPFEFYGLHILKMLWWKKANTVENINHTNTIIAAVLWKKNQFQHINFHLNLAFIWGGCK